MAARCSITRVAGMMGDGNAGIPHLPEIQRRSHQLRYPPLPARPDSPSPAPLASLRACVPGSQGGGGT
jgi:hypothetical protein